MKRSVALNLLMLIVLLTASGCGWLGGGDDEYSVTPGEWTEAPDDDDAESIGVPEGSRPRPIDPDELGPEGALGTVYFDYDSSNIRIDQQLALEANMRYLLDHPSLQVRIEGHCDERGTVEYNFALGERRATSVREFLIGRGVEPDKISVLSMGEEQPVEFGANEGAWSKNRRAEFVPTR